MSIDRASCPTPQKLAHPTSWQADAALGKAWRRGRGTHLPCRTYHCACGAWHLTSQPYQPRRPHEV